MKYLRAFMVLSFAVVLSSCAHVSSTYRVMGSSLNFNPNANYAERLPCRLNTRGEKVVLVDPKMHAWGAYDRDGTLLRAGIATAGANKCEDSDRSCRTSVGSFRIVSLGSVDCKSSKYPKPHGGGIMPFCMFFHGGDSLHGAPDHILAEDNLSHGCVRMRIPDAEWVRYSFANIGTKVIVKPYE